MNAANSHINRVFKVDADDNLHLPTPRTPSNVDKWKYNYANVGMWSKATAKTIPSPTFPCTEHTTPRRQSLA